MWNISKGEANNNVYKTYIRNPKKNKQYKIIDMGAYCLINDITPDLLRVFVENGKRIVDVLAGNGTDVSKEHKKVVVMDEEEYKNYEMFKAMKNVMSGK
jgi:hypothetical protein